MFITDRASHLAIGKLPLGKLAFLEEFQVPNYWMRRRTFGLVVLAAVGWLLHGLGLYAVVHDLDGAENPLLWALFSGPASTCLGAGVGMPGGIGATEGFLGVALKSLTSVAGADMLLAVAAFRFNTFWVWLPFGWIALSLVNRLRNRG